MRIVPRFTVTAFVALVAAVVGCAQSTQPAAHRLLTAGKLIKVDGAKLVIQPMWQPPQAKSVIVETDHLTRVILDTKSSSLDKLQPGMDVSAGREAPSARDPNPQLIVQAWSPSSTGLISAVEGAAIRLTGTPSGTEPESPLVQTDRHTKIIRMASLVGENWDEGAPMKLDELKPEMLIKAMPPRGVASTIFVWPARIRAPATMPRETDRRP